MLVGSTAMILLTSVMSHSLYTHHIVREVEDQALRIAEHFGAELEWYESEGGVAHYIRDEAARIREPFNLDALRFYGVDGHLIYSTDEPDEEATGTRSYIRDFARLKLPHAVLLESGQETWEGERVTHPLIEVYLPVIGKGRVIGIVEAYFDVTAKLARLNRIYIIFVVVLTSITLGFILVASWALGGAERNIALRESAEENLRRMNESLEAEVTRRTADLASVNKKLIEEIREHQAVSSELARNQEMLAKITAAARDGIVMTDSNAKITFWNEGAERIFGFSRDEVLGSPVHEVIAPERYREEAFDGFERFRESGSGPIVGRNFDITALRKNGEEFPVTLSVSPVRLDGAWHAVAVVRDETDRKRVQVALWESMSRFRTLFEESLNPVVLFRRNSAEPYDANPRALRLFGISKKDFLEGALDGFLGEGDRSRFREHVIYAEETGGFVMENREVQLRDGTQLNISIHGRPILLEGEDVIYCTFHDHTEELRLRQNWNRSMQQLIQSEKMTFLGTMVSGFAHDINNPNQLIAVNLPLMEKIWADMKPIIRDHEKKHPNTRIGGLPVSMLLGRMPEILEDMKSGSERISSFIHGLVNFAKNEQSAPRQNVNINHVVENVLRLLKHRIKNSTDAFTTSLARTLPMVRGNAQQLEQVVMNLLGNALESLPSRDRSVSITTEYDARSGTVRLVVRDAGMGMPDEVRARAFEAFYTTKGDSGGTGLGLAIVNLFVKEHGGSVVFESRIEEGTTAVLTLPVVQ